MGFSWGKDQPAPPRHPYLHAGERRRRSWWAWKESSLPPAGTDLSPPPFPVNRLPFRAVWRFQKGMLTRGRSSDEERKLIHTYQIHLAVGFGALGSGRFPFSLLLRQQNQRSGRERRKWAWYPSPEEQGTEKQKRESKARAESHGF